MMTHNERVVALNRMRNVSEDFYMFAVRIGNHPFIEFTGLLNEYIKICQNAHDAGIDFSDCSGHTGAELPMKQHNIEYIQQKLECIFGGRISVGVSEPLGT